MSTKLEVMKEWAKPAGIALLVAALATFTTWKTSYQAMGAQVAENSASISAITKGLVALANDKVSELKARLAVLRHIAGQNGGLNGQQQLEYDAIEKRLKDLK